jgi:uncharacterized membrane protein
MKYYSILAGVIFLFGCGGDVTTSHQGDFQRYGIQFSGSASFQQAAPIIFEKCIGCHSGYHNNWAGYVTEADWTSSSLITPGSAINSTLYRKIDISGTPEGNMPPSGSGLLVTVDELEILRVWIDGP